MEFAKIIDSVKLARNALSSASQHWKRIRNTSSEAIFYTANNTESDSLLKFKKKIDSSNDFIQNNIHAQRNIESYHFPRNMRKREREKTYKLDAAEFICLSLKKVVKKTFDLIKTFDEPGGLMCLRSIKIKTSKKFRSDSADNFQLREVIWTDQYQIKCYLTFRGIFNKLLQNRLRSVFSLISAEQHSRNHKKLFSSSTNRVLYSDTFDDYESSCQSSCTVRETALHRSSSSLAAGKIVRISGGIIREKAQNIENQRPNSREYRKSTEYGKVRSSNDLVCFEFSSKEIEARPSKGLLGRCENNRYNYLTTIPKTAEKISLIPREHNYKNILVIHNENAPVKSKPSIRNMTKVEQEGKNMAESFISAKCELKYNNEQYFCKNIKINDFKNTKITLSYDSGVYGVVNSDCANLNLMSQKKLNAEEAFILSSFYNVLRSIEKRATLKNICSKLLRIDCTPFSLKILEKLCQQKVFWTLVQNFNLSKNESLKSLRQKMLLRKYIEIWEKEYKNRSNQWIFKFYFWRQLLHLHKLQRLKKYKNIFS